MDQIKRLSYKAFPYHKRYLILLIVLFTQSNIFGYGNEHTDITQKSIKNYLNWVLQDPENRYGATQLNNSVYLQLILDGAIDEDSGDVFGDPAPWLSHYGDHSGNGLFYNGVLNVNAEVRAQQHWEKMMDYFAEGDLNLGYWMLGRILHLIEDMGVPAHTLLSDQQQVDLSYFLLYYNVALL